jgi:predicted nucleotide-binding protein
VSGDTYGNANSGGGNISFGNSGNQTMGSGSPITIGAPGGDEHGRQDQASDQTPRPYRFAAAARADRASADRTRNVFVIHGRDEQVRGAIFTLLRRLDLHPQEWEDLVANTGATAPYLGQVLAEAPDRAQAAMVLMTPDDLVMLHPELHGPREHSYEVEAKCQPRPNVLIELGMVLMAYPERTLIVVVGELRPIADLDGRNVIHFDGSPNSVGKIVERLKLAGCTVNDTGADWRDPGPYQDFNAYRRRP